MNTRIAVVGAGVRLPARIQSLDDLWEVLRNGQDQVTETPPSRFNPEFFYHPDREATGTSVSKWGAYLDDIDQFDPVAFNISPREAALMDPQQRLALITALEAIEDASIKLTDLHEKSVGVFFGVSTWDYAMQQFSPLSMKDLDMYSATGMAHSVVANRVSYALNLRGVSLSVDTACSSALMAIHLAAKSIASGESTMAIAGGVNCILGPGNTIAFSKMGILSPGGRCKAFSENADGFVRAEGAGAVLLMPETEAIRTGRDIYCVIEATGSNQDGLTNGLAVPSGDAQSELLRSIYNKRRVDPSDLGYFEAHGTGTVVGDAIEAHSIGSILKDTDRNGSLVVGSVKTNFGHLESASGIAGFLKALLVCDRGQIPPNLHFDTPSKYIDFKDLGIEVAQGVQQLRPGSVVGINSFGFGGANVHVALRSLLTRAKTAPSQPENASPNRHRHLLLSAASPAHLREHLLGAINLFQTSDASLETLCAAYAHRRTDLRFRKSFIAQTRDDMLAQLQASAEASAESGTLDDAVGARPDPGQTCLYFTGQGSQWLGMGQELQAASPVFRETYLRCDAIVEAETGFSLNAEMQGDAAKSGIVEKTSLAQPAIAAFQIALSEMLIQEGGVSVSGVVGHSVGEIAASYVAGVFSLEDAMRLAARRGQLVEAKAASGKMLVVKAAMELQKQHLSAHPNVEICAYNSPDLLSVGGEAEAVDALRKSLRKAKIICKEMPMPYAFHTSLIEGCADGFDAMFADLKPNRPARPFYSTVTGKKRSKFDEAYWWKNLRQPVRFLQALNSAAEAGCTTFIEVSPNPTLVGQAKDSLADGKHDAEVFTTGATGSEASAVAEAMGKLWCAGTDIDTTALVQDDPMALSVELPRYPWVNQKLWSENHESRNVRTEERVSRLLGQSVPGTMRSWILNTDAKHFPMIEQHLFNGAPLFPATGFLEMAVSAASQLQETDTVALANLEILAGLFLGKTNKAIQFRVEHSSSNDTLNVSSRLDPNSDTWTRNARANLVRPLSGGFSGGIADVERVKQAAPNWYHGDVIYEICSLSQLQYMPELQLVKEVWTTDNEVVATIDASSLTDLEDFFLHPAVFDACLHPGNLNRDAHFGIDATHFTFVPLRLGRIDMFRKLRGQKFTTHVRKIADTLRYAIGDLTIYDENGDAVLHIDRFESLGLEISNDRAESNFDKFSYGIEWLKDTSLDGVAAQ